MTTVGAGGKAVSCVDYNKYPNCLVADSDGIATMCEEGYGIKAGKCITCAGTANCADGACTMNDAGAMVCSACDDGTYLNAAFTCASCFTHCGKCTAANLCDACHDGFFLSAD